ncbi:hypothetical protein DXA34_10815 [[Clostridium] symbiosum]|nr:hypothetical protein DXA34_10815 [[Clostridium] symbiosum]
MRGKSGRNELLRGLFALFGVRSGSKLVRNLVKHRRTPMSPPQLIPPTSPGTKDSYTHPAPRPLAVPAASSPA